MIKKGTDILEEKDKRWREERSYIAWHSCQSQEEMIVRIKMVTVMVMVMVIHIAIHHFPREKIWLSHHAIDYEEYPLKYSKNISTFSNI